MREAGTRLHLLDALRGFAIFNVLAFHFLYDVYVVYGLAPDWPAKEYVRLWQVLGSGLFIFISGMVLHVSGRYFRRGLQLNLLGAAITLITALVMPAQAIYYGILTFFGCSWWLFACLKPVLVKIKPILGMLMALICYLVTMDIDAGKAVIAGTVLWQWPEFLYINELAVLGFHNDDFSSADYFPLLPNFFVMLWGWFTYAFLQEHNCLVILKTCNWRLFTIPGRHSLVIYIVHQPVLLLLCRMWFGY